MDDNNLVARGQESARPDGRFPREVVPPQIGRDDRYQRRDMLDPLVSVIVYADVGSMTRKEKEKPTSIFGQTERLTAVRKFFLWIFEVLLCDHIGKPRP